jgi:protein tyrosine/serine phosphatase
MIVWTTLRRAALSYLRFNIWLFQQIEPIHLWRALPVVTMLLICTLVGYGHYKAHKRFAAHDPGQMYRSSWLQPEVFERVVRRYQIKTVVNLCVPGEAPQWYEAEREAVERAGGRFVNLQFPSNWSSDLDYESVREMARLLKDPNAYPIHVHCYHGLERTAKALAMYDIAHRGMSAEESMTKMEQFDYPHREPIIRFAENYEAAIRHK